MVFSNYSNVVIMGAFRDIYRSFDYGANWSTLHQFDFATAVLSIANDTVSTNTMFIGTDTDGLKEPTDRGASWNRTVDHENVFGSVVNGLFRSTDGGATRRPVLNLDNSYGTAILFDLCNPGDMYSSFSYTTAVRLGRRSTTDFRLSMSSRWPSIPNGILYAGTEVAGIRVSYDGGQSWN